MLTKSHFRWHSRVQNLRDQFETNWNRLNPCIGPFFIYKNSFSHQHPRSVSEDIGFNLRVQLIKIVRFASSVHFSQICFTCLLLPIALQTHWMSIGIRSWWSYFLITMYQFYFVFFIFKKKITSFKFQIRFFFFTKTSTTRVSSKLKFIFSFCIYDKFKFYFFSQCD